VNVIFTILGDVTGYDWLHKPLHKFGGKSAVELLKTERGKGVKSLYYEIT